MRVEHAEMRSKVEPPLRGQPLDEAKLQPQHSLSVPCDVGVVQLKAGRRALLERPTPAAPWHQVNGLRAMANKAVQMQSMGHQSANIGAGLGAGVGGEREAKYKRIIEDGRVKIIEVETGRVLREFSTEESRRQTQSERYEERTKGDALEVIDTHTGEVVRETPIEGGAGQGQPTRSFKERVKDGFLEVVDERTGEVVRRTRLERQSGKEDKGVEGVEAVQERSASQAQAPGASAVRRHAAHGVRGAGSSLPHQASIQASFGRHDVSAVQAYVGGAAREATEAMGAEAYATGDKVAFGETPSLHTAAHEAAHVVQQRAGVKLKGGVGQVGDDYERHADAVADLVVRGESAEMLLSDFVSGDGQESVQLKNDPLAEGGVVAERDAEGAPEEAHEQAHMAALFAAQEEVKAKGFGVQVSPAGPSAFRVVVSSGELKRGFSSEEFIQMAPSLRPGFLGHSAPGVAVETEVRRGESYDMEVRSDITLAHGSAMMTVPGLGAVQVDVNLVWVASFKEVRGLESAATLGVKDGKLDGLKASLKSAFGALSVKATPDGGACSLSFPVGDVSVSTKVGYSTKGWSLGGSMRPRPISIDGVSGGLQGSVKLSQPWSQCMAPGLLAAYKTAQVGVESSAAQTFEEWVLQQDHQKWMAGILAGTALVVVGIPLAASTTSTVAGVAATAEGAAVAQSLAGAAPVLATTR